MADFTKGLICPGCGIKGSWGGGRISASLQTANFYCPECSFGGFFVICRKGYEYKVEPIKVDE